MLKFANPYFKTTAQANAEAKAAADAPIIDAWLKTQVNNRVITLNEIKTALPAIAADLDRLTFNIIARQLGLVYEDASDPQT